MAGGGGYPGWPDEWFSREADELSALSFESFCEQSSALYGCHFARAHRHLFDAAQVSGLAFGLDDVDPDACQCHPRSVVPVSDCLFGCDARVLDAGDFDRRFYYLFVRVFPERTHVPARFHTGPHPGNSQTVTIPLRGLFSDLDFHGTGERRGNLARHVDPGLLGLVDLSRRQCLVARRLAQVPGNRRLTRAAQNLPNQKVVRSAEVLTTVTTVLFSPLAARVDPVFNLFTFPISVYPSEFFGGSRCSRERPMKRGRAP